MAYVAQMEKMMKEIVVRKIIQFAMTHVVKRIDVLKTKLHLKNFVAKIQILTH